MRKQLSCLLMSCFAVAANATPIAEPPQFSVDKPQTEYTRNVILGATEKAKTTCITGLVPASTFVCMAVPVGWAEIESDPARWKEVKVKLWNASMDDIDDTIEEWTKTCVTYLMSTSDANKKVANFYCSWHVRSKIAALASSPPK